MGAGFLLAQLLSHRPSHAVRSVVWGPLVGPIVAIVSFVCSIGNVPLAAVLWNGGISFGGVIAFIYADLTADELVTLRSEPESEGVFRRCHRSPQNESVTEPSPPSRHAPGRPRAAITDLRLLVRVPGRPEDVRAFTDAERDEAAAYAAQTGGITEHLPI